MRISSLKYSFFGVLFRRYKQLFEHVASICISNEVVSNVDMLSPIVHLTILYNRMFAGAVGLDWASDGEAKILDSLL